MPGKQNADPLPATTYAGFAAAPPDDGEDGPQTGRGTARTYSRAELRRGGSRRGWAPIAAGAALAATFALGAALSFALLHNPAAVRTRPVEVREAPAPAPAAAPALASAPLASDIDSPLPPPAPDPAASEAIALTPPPPPPPRRVAPRPKAVHAPGPRPDPRLAALDQELNRAFAEAVRSGAAAGPLGEQQEAWIIRRDRIRREDPELAEDLYRARIAELRALSAPSADPTPAAP